jgi:hypothetical protein
VKIKLKPPHSTKYLTAVAFTFILNLETNGKNEKTPSTDGVV